MRVASEFLAGRELIAVFRNKREILRNTLAEKTRKIWNVILLFLNFFKGATMVQKHLIGPPHIKTARHIVAVSEYMNYKEPVDGIKGSLMRHGLQGDFGIFTVLQGADLRNM